MAINLVASTGTLLLLVVLLRLAGTQAAESSTQATNFRKQDCKVTIVGDRAFVTCNLTVDVGKKKVKFHLQYKKENNSENDSLKTNYELAFSCFWPDNDVYPTCNGDTGYRLNSTNVTSVVVIEVPRQGVEAKMYYCQIGGSTEPNLAQPCSLSTTPADTTTTATTTGKAAVDQGDEKWRIAFIVVSAILAIVVVKMFVAVIILYQRRKKQPTEITVPMERSLTETDGMLEPVASSTEHNAAVGL